MGLLLTGTLGTVLSGRRTRFTEENGNVVLEGDGKYVVWG